MKFDHLFFVDCSDVLSWTEKPLLKKKLKAKPRLVPGDQRLGVKHTKSGFIEMQGTAVDKKNKQKKASTFHKITVKVDDTGHTLPAWCAETRRADGAGGKRDRAGTAEIKIEKCR